MSAEKIIEIDYNRCGKALLRNIPLILAITILCTFIGAIVIYSTMETEDLYEARASVFSVSGDVYEETLDVVQYADIVKSLKVGQRAAMILNDPNMDEYKIYDMVEVLYDDSPYTTISSAVINIHTQSTDSNMAIKVVNAVAEAFTIESFDITGSDRFKVLDTATSSIKVYDAQKKMSVYLLVLGIAILILVCFLIVMIEILSLRLNTVKDGTLNGKLDIIGVVPYID